VNSIWDLIGYDESMPSLTHLQTTQVGVRTRKEITLRWRWLLVAILGRLTVLW